MENLGVNERIILKYILEERVVTKCITLFWLKTGISSRIKITDTETRNVSDSARYLIKSMPTSFSPDSDLYASFFLG
jgi:hypothetical protein